jgi:hypothetical protein
VKNALIELGILLSCITGVSLVILGIVFTVEAIVGGVIP